MLTLMYTPGRHGSQDIKSPFELFAPEAIQKILLIALIKREGMFLERRGRGWIIYKKLCCNSKNPSVHALGACKKCTCNKRNALLLVFVKAGVKKQRWSRRAVQTESRLTD